VAPGEFDDIVVGRYGSDGSPIVFGIGTPAAGNRQVFAARLDANAQLAAGWFSFAPGQFTALTVGAFGSGNAEVCGISIDHQAYLARFSATGAFTDGWGLVAPGQFTALAAADRPGGALELFGTGFDGQAYAATLNSAGTLAAGWFAANSTQPVGLSQITAVAPSNADPVVFALGTDHRAYEARFDAGTGVKAGSWIQLATDGFEELAAGARLGKAQLYGIAAAALDVEAALFDTAGIMQGGFFSTASDRFTDLAVAG
jgi:hypothetical protein